MKKKYVYITGIKEIGELIWVLKYVIFKLISIKRFSNWTEITHYFSFFGVDIKGRYIPEKISLGVLRQRKLVYIIGIKEIGELI